MSEKHACSQIHRMRISSSINIRSMFTLRLLQAFPATARNFQVTSAMHLANLSLSDRRSRILHCSEQRVRAYRQKIRMNFISKREGSDFLQTDIEFLQSLIRIDSTNPPGNEHQVVEQFIQRSEAVGLPYEVTDLSENRSNFSVTLKGSDENKGRLL